MEQTPKSREIEPLHSKAYDKLRRLCDVLCVPGSKIPQNSDEFLTNILLRRDCDYSRLRISALAVIQSYTGTMQMLENAWSNNLEQLDNSLKNGQIVVFLNLPLVQALLRTTTIPDLRFELLLTHTRLRLLECACDPNWFYDDETFNVAVSISLYAFSTEYIFPESEYETNLLEKLIKLAINKPNAFRISVLAAYRRLLDIEQLNSETLAQVLSSDSFSKDLARVQIYEPQYERQLSALIPSVTFGENNVSLEVQSHYEESPYPRWLSHTYNRAVSAPEFFQRACPNVDLNTFSSDDTIKILVAGCGTGKVAIEERLMWQNANVVAMDLSKPSLAFARRCSDELGLDSISFVHGDILKLEPDIQVFDYISCIGVLHHMENPIEGWQALSSVCRSGGVMRICVYSALSRESVRHAATIVGSKAMAFKPETIRKARKELIDKAFRADKPDMILQTLFESDDVYNMSMCRDLLFHNHEKEFNIVDILDTITSLGLTFCGFIDPHDHFMRQYHEFAPDDPMGIDLQSWHAFELLNPGTFKGMYDFMVQKI